MSLKYSIICPCYNSEKWVSFAIESILKQTYKNWELILINDGSTDNTESILKKYKKLYPKKIKLFSQINKGPFLARMFGINNSTGDYVLFLDSDNIFYSFALEHLSRLLSNSCCDLLVFSMNEVNKNDQIIDIKNNKDFILSFSEEIISFLFFSDLNDTGYLSNKCIKKTLLSNISLNENLSIFSIKHKEDYLFLSLIAGNIKKLISSKIVLSESKHYSDIFNHQIAYKQRMNDYFYEELCIIYPFVLKRLTPKINDNKMKSFYKNRMYEFFLLINRLFITKDKQMLCRINNNCFLQFLIKNYKKSLPFKSRFFMTCFDKHWFLLCSFLSHFSKIKYEKNN